jgi:hypothetical protein
VLTEEKLDGIGARLEYTPGKLLKCLVSKSSARTATQLLKPSSESWCAVSVLYVCSLMKQSIVKDIYV